MSTNGRQSEMALLTAQGDRIVDGTGQRVQLRGVGIGGWLNMENFITGYPATETVMREAVAAVIGAERAQRFFDRLLTVFFADADVDFLAGLGFNCVRLPVNYHHFEDDDRPLEIQEDGFAHLDRAVRRCASRGIYTVIDLHALPGGHNQHWHSDNPTHVAQFWQHRHFQDRVVGIWEAIAQRYRDEPYVAGYNLINEPGEPGGQVLTRFYDRLIRAVRAVDPKHLLFLDGNRYATDFSIFTEPAENTVYACHDYAPPGFAHGGPYPGQTGGEWVDREVVERTFLRRTEFQRRTGTPLWVGEFGPVYTGDPARDEQRYRLLADQLDIYRQYGAGWSIWTYKDIGLQGLVYADPAGAYLTRFRDIIDKKARLGLDSWGSTGEELSAVLEPLHSLVAEEFPQWSGYPWSARDTTNDVVKHLLFGQALVGQYAEVFASCDDQALFDLADSFALARCGRRERLCTLLASYADLPIASV